LLWTLPVNGSGAGKTEPGKPGAPSDLLIVSGTIANLQGKAVKEVGRRFYPNGEKLELEEEVSTSKAGVFEAQLKVPKGALPGARVEMAAAKPSFQTSDRMVLDKVLPERMDDKGNTVFLVHQSLKMKRAISPVILTIRALFRVSDFVLRISVIPVIPRQEISRHPFDAAFAVHQHIHLAGEDQQASQLIQFLFDNRAFVFLKPGVHPVSLDFDGEIQFVEDLSDGPYPPVLPDIVRRPAF
jgi:hypothetical protein